MHAPCRQNLLNIIHDFTILGEIFISVIFLVAERPNKLPKWELGFGKNILNTKL